MRRAEVFIVLFVMFVSLLSGCILPRDNLPPEPNLKASDTFVNVNEVVTFSANDSRDQDGEIVRYYWDMDDGTNYTAKYVSHEYAEGGNYTVILIVTDNEGKKAVQAMTIHVNEVPVPIIDMSLFAYIHEPVYFWANDSYDPDGFITDFYWDLGDGSNYSGMSAQNVYTLKKTFTVWLTVTDNDGGRATASMEFPIRFRTYAVTWVTGSVVVGVDDGTLLEGYSELYEANVSVLNITKMEFNLEWDDDFHLPESPNDIFRLNVTSPDEQESYQDEDLDEKITIKLPKGNTVFNEIPWSGEEEMEAESPEILWKLLAQNHTTGEGRGDWAINITMVEANGYIGGPVDLGNDWDFYIECYYYTPVITRL